jgi:hypothetical protein
LPPPQGGGKGSLPTTPTAGLEHEEEQQQSEATGSRGYEALLDRFSLHEFLIRRGATLDGTPEFESFKRAFEPCWHLVGDLIVRLEETCRRVRDRTLQPY